MRAVALPSLWRLEAYEGDAVTQRCPVCGDVPLLFWPWSRPMWCRIFVGRRYEEICLPCYQWATYYLNGGLR